MKSVWDPRLEAELLARTAALRPGTPPQWGRLTCARMVVHVTDALTMYMGQVSAAGRWTPLRHAPLKQAFIYVLPIPRNVPTAPELLSRDPGSWDEEQDRFARTLTAFCRHRSRAEWPLHPIFGRLTPRAIGVLAYKHTDHHLRQFGA
jgi:hypothetical protein